MRADTLYEAALALLGEEEYSCEDYTHLRFRIINYVVALFLSTQNTINLAKGVSAKETFLPIVKDSDIVPLDENFALEAAAPMVAALLVADHDRDKANVLSAMAENAKKKYSKVNFLNVADNY